MAGRSRLIGTTALVLGNLIGAGILALPISLGVAGLVPSVLLTLVYSAMMLFSAEVLARESAEERNPTFDYPTLYGRYLGRAGKWIATITNAIILYGLLVAYVAGGSKIVASLFGFDGSPAWLALAFAMALTFLTMLDLSVIDKYNTVLVLGLLAAFLGLVGVSCDKIDIAAFGDAHWEYFGLAIPLVVTAAHFHNIIPTLSADLGWDLKTLRKAMLLGMILAAVMNLAWVACGIGCLPRLGDNSLIASYAQAMPATVPMGKVLNRHMFSVLAVTFSLVAIATSFLANGIGLQNFVRDLCWNSLRIQSRTLVRVLTFAPPTLIALLWPDVFIKALDIVGGIGIVTLFGVLPCILALRKRNVTNGFKALAAIFLALSLVALATVIGGFCGSKLLKPNPADEVATAEAE